MDNETTVKLLSALEQQGPVKREGKGWRASCPNPSHEDRHPSFFLYPDGAGYCFSRCSRYWKPKELAEMLGIEPPKASSDLTVAELAYAKGIPVDFLRTHGVSDGYSGAGASRQRCVDISYMNESGEIIAVRKRLSITGTPRFIWRRGDHPTLHGLHRMRDIREAGYVILVEGESDSWTLWFSGFQALGIPGASTWREQYASLLQGLTVYLWHEPDGGGDTLVKAVTQDLPDVRIVDPPHWAKDPSELFQFDPDGFKETLESLMAAARPAAQIKSDALSEQARTCFKLAQPLLDAPDLLQRLAKTVRSLGYVGDVRPALMSYIVLTSRLLDNPLNVAFISPSAAGKNAAAECPLPLFPESAFFIVRAASPRALVYNEESFSHRIVIMTEADSLPEEGPAASAIRSIISDRQMSYEVVEKGLDGKFATRRIVKEGPTGLMTTSIKALGEQANTRTLSASISDSEEQTRLVMHAQADKANRVSSLLDLDAWIAVQNWLELAGVTEVRIEYAHTLADLIPATAVRMRRDFAQLLTVIQVFTLLHQRQRQYDEHGQIIASIEDYAMARWLLEEIFTTTFNDGASPAIRETVESVARLSADGAPVTEKQLVEELGLSKSSINYRVKRALEAGFLINKSKHKGSRAQLVLGSPIQEGCPLPTVEELTVCVEDSGNRSNLRTESSKQSNYGSETVRKGFEPGSNGSHGFEDSSKGYSNRSIAQSSPFEEGFEGFERNSGDDAHTEDMDSGGNPEGGDDSDADAGEIVI